MDNFIDKLAQKFTTTEPARPVSTGDSKEIAKLKEKIEGYETLLQEMKQLNLKNIESAHKLEELVDSNVELAKNSDGTVCGPNKEYLDEMFDKTSDTIHKENVKVYRNVQATMQASLEDQTKAIVEATEVNAKKNSTTFLKVMSVLIFLAVLADIALKVLGILGIL